MHLIYSDNGDPYVNKYDAECGDNVTGWFHIICLIKRKVTDFRAPVSLFLKYGLLLCFHIVPKV